MEKYEKLREEKKEQDFIENMKEALKPENKAKSAEKYLNKLERERETGIINSGNVRYDFEQNNIKAIYNKDNDNYDIISTRLDYKGCEYKIFSCDKNGIVETNAYDMDLDLMSDYSSFYGYVQNFQALKADEKYKDFDINCYGGYCDMFEILKLI